MAASSQDINAQAMPASRDGVLSGTV
jgi:hypothetical protein